jgi:hypothetical protein
MHLIPASPHKYALRQGEANALTMPRGEHPPCGFAFSLFGLIYAPSAYAAYVGDPVAELATYFQSKNKVPDEDLIRLTRAARVAGRSWEAIAATCGVRTSRDTDGVVSGPSGIIPSTGEGSYTGPPSTRWRSSAAAAGTRC